MHLLHLTTEHYCIAYLRDAQNTIAYSWAESSNRPFYNKALNISWKLSLSTHLVAFSTQIMIYNFIIFNR